VRGKKMHGEEEGMLRREKKTTMSVKKMKQEHLSSTAKKGGCELQPTAEIGGWDHVGGCECRDELGAVSSGISSIQMSRDGVGHRSWNLLDVTWRSALTWWASCAPLRSSSAEKRAYCCQWKKEPGRAREPLQIPSAMI